VRAVLSSVDPLSGPFDPSTPNETSSLGLSFTVFDSAGTEHSMSLFFTRADAGLWAVNAVIPGPSVEGAPADQPFALALGELEFDALGRLTAVDMPMPVEVDWRGDGPALLRFTFGTALTQDGDGLDGVVESDVAPESRLVDVFQNGNARRGGCDVNADCVNSVGGHACVCWPGFRGDGVECVDIDECEEGDDNCSEHAVCGNTQGGFTCACVPGYSGTGVQCRDRDECLHSEHDCAEQAVCANTAGSFVCTCNEGYAGSGQVCDDIDECAAAVSPCAADRECTNLVGSFICDPI